MTSEWMGTRETIPRVAPITTVIKVERPITSNHITWGVTPEVTTTPHPGDGPTMSMLSPMSNPGDRVATTLRPITLTVRAQREASTNTACKSYCELGQDAWAL